MRIAFLTILILFVACNKTETVSEGKKQDPQCLEYQSKVLEAAIIEKEVNEDVIYQFKSDEKEAVSLLKAFTHKHDKSQAQIEAIKDLAKDCTVEKIEQLSKASLNKPCDTIFSEFKFFKGLIWQLKQKNTWSNGTKTLALNTTLDNIRHYANKPSTMLQLAIAIELYKDVINSNLAGKNHKTEINGLHQELNQQLEELHRLHKNALNNPVSCQNSVYFKEFSMAEEFRSKLQKLL